MFGYGGSTGGLDAGTVNSGLTGGMANLLMTLTGGLACLAVWRSSLNFRLGKKPDWKWIPPFILLAAALSLGLNIVIAYLGLAQHSQTFQQVAKEQAAVPLWLGICCMDLQRLFPRTGIPGNYLWEIQRGIRRACCHGIFRRGFRHLPREPGAGDICFPAWHHACLGDGTIRHTFGSRYFSWDRESCCFFPYRCGRAGEYPCAAACMRGAAGNFRCLLLVSGYQECCRLTRSFICSRKEAGPNTCTTGPKERISISSSVSSVRS